MKYLQVMPPEQTILGLDVGLLLTLSIVLIGVIFLFDKSKVIVNWIVKRKS